MFCKKHRPGNDTPAILCEFLPIYMCARTSPRDLIVGRLESSIPARLIWIAPARSTPGGRADNEEKLAFLFCLMQLSRPREKTERPATAPPEGTPAEPDRKNKQTYTFSLCPPAREARKPGQEAPGQNETRTQKTKKAPGRKRGAAATKNKQAQHP